MTPKRNDEYLPTFVCSFKQETERFLLPKSYPYKACLQYMYRQSKLGKPIHEMPCMSKWGQLPPLFPPPAVLIIIDIINHQRSIIILQEIQK